jgi:hypothetical protein
MPRPRLDLSLIKSFPTNVWHTWQLIINTGTTIVTFLTVFLIQNTQNRDSEARIRRSFYLNVKTTSTLDVTIFDPGNSVVVWDKNSQVEYLG